MDGLVVDTPADLVNSVEANFFDDVTPDADPVIETAPETDDVIETPTDLDEPEVTPEEDEPLDEEVPEEEEPQAAKPATDDLPDGVTKGKDRNGKEGLFVKPERWETIHGGYKTVQQVSEIIGEPATLEALQLRNEAFEAQERMHAHLTDPGSQAAVIDHFLGHMQRSRETGEIGHDATVPFAKNVYAAVSARERFPDGRENPNGKLLYPDAQAHLQLSAAKDTLNGLFEEAAKSNNTDLLLSLQHVVKAMTGGSDAASTRAIAERMGLPFYTKAEMANLAKGADPLVQSRQRIQDLESQLIGRSAANQAAQLTAWRNETNRSIETGISEDAVQPALAAIAEAWKPFPAQYKEHIVDKLHSKVADILKADSAFQNRIKGLQGRAKNATSAQVRADISTQIRTAYVNRAKLAADPNGNNFRAIINDANKILTGLSKSNHERRQSAQGRTAPTRGSQGSVNRSIRPANDFASTGGVFDPSIAMRTGAAALR